ncbi:MAG TPA: hypothetical protein VIA62_12570 [Thermoanaerobaculia bacterium]|jgi:hypothetical protein|nr:hypothetical protein [Thermoanaerobaculia bacterium]
MSSTPRQLRLNIYMDEPDLRQAVKIAAAKEGVTLSAYCVRAVRRQLVEEGFLPGSSERQAAAARAMDRLRRQIGPIGVPVRKLIDEGRRR